MWLYFILYSTEQLYSYCQPVALVRVLHKGNTTSMTTMKTTSWNALVQQKYCSTLVLYNNNDLYEIRLQVKLTWKHNNYVNLITSDNKLDHLCWSLHFWLRQNAFFHYCKYPRGAETFAVPSPSVSILISTLYTLHAAEFRQQSVERCGERKGIA